MSIHYPESIGAPISSLTSSPPKKIARGGPNLVSPISKKTAMHWAVNRRDLQRVWLLLQFGGDQRTRKDGLSVHDTATDG